MLNLKKIVQEMSEDHLFVATTQILKTYGLNDYYIKRGISEGYFKKRERGVYEILCSINKTISVNAFHVFKNQVISKDFSLAYKSLKKNFDHRVEFSYDNHLRIYFLLLKELLDFKDDFSFLDQISEFSEIYNPDSYYTYFVQFRYAVMEQDFSSAYQNLMKFKEADYAKDHRVLISTNLFEILVTEVLNREKLRIEEENHQAYEKYYHSFLNYLDQNDYQFALENLKLALSLDASPRLLAYQNLLEKYFELLEQETIIPKLSQGITMISDEQRLTSFYQFLENSHYREAYQLFLENLNLFEEEERTVYNVLFSNLWDVDQTYKSQIYQKYRNQLYSQIMALDYEKAKELIQFLNEEGYQERIYDILSRLLKINERILSCRFKFETASHSHEKQSSVFKDFYIALKEKNFEEAYQYAILCDNFSKQQDPENFEYEIYACVLKDILKSIEVTKERYEKLNLYQDHSLGYQNFLHSVQVNNYSSEQLKEELSKRLEYCPLNEQEYIYHALNLNDMIQLFSENKVADHYFEQFSYHHDNLKENFWEAMNLGDYISAQKFLLSPEWLQVNQNVPFKSYYILYRRLFMIMNYFKQNCSSELSLSLEEEKDATIVYEKIRTFIKKRDYWAAYDFYLNHYSEFSFSHGLFQTFFQLVIPYQFGEEQEHFDSYWKAMKEQDLNMARYHLLSMEEMNQGKCVTYDYSFLHDQMNILTKNLQQNNYEEKNQYLNQAIEFFQNRNYANCFLNLNKYIACDRDLNYVGYYFRGLVFLMLKDFDSAVQDFQASLKISKQPMTLFQLGRIYMQLEDYETALNYFLEYHKMNPRQVMVLNFMYQCYEKLGMEKEANEYQELHYRLVKMKKLEF